MADAVDSQYLPPAADQFRGEFLFNEPQAGLVFESLGKTPCFVFVAMALVGEFLGSFRAIGIVCALLFAYIACKFPTDR
jgi:hypothetical protein